MPSASLPNRAGLARLATSLLFCVTGGSLASCGGAAQAVVTPKPAPSIEAAFVQALAAETLDSTSAEPYLDAIDQAVALPRSSGALASVLGSVDALALGASTGLEGLSDQAVAFRSRELFPLVFARLERAFRAGEDRREALDSGVVGDDPEPYAPLFLRGAIARGLHEMALYAGDETAAANWGLRRGCVSEATLLGPLDASPLLGLDEPSPVVFDAPFAAHYPGIAPFAAEVIPVVRHADACLLDLNATSFLQGVRALVVDVESPRAQTIGLALSTTSAAVVDVGGVRALRRGFEAGGGFVTRLAAVAVPEGKTRIVVRVAQKSDGNLVELDVWGGDGLPLRTTAPKAGDVASGRGGSARPVTIAMPPSAEAAPSTLALSAAGLLALGEARVAEHMLEGALGGAPEDVPPYLGLLYARAVDQAEDLPDNQANEVIRASVDRVLAQSPDAWEAVLLHAGITERRRGYGEGVIAALRELGAQPIEPVVSGDEADAPQSGPYDRVSGPDRMTLAYAALAADRAALRDVAEDATERLSQLAPGSPLLAAVFRVVHPRVGSDAVTAACKGGGSRADDDCLGALVSQGDLPVILGEIERLRRLRTGPEALLDVELAARIAHGDAQGALAVYDAMPPAMRTLLSAPGLLAARHEAGPAKERLMRDRITARDAPFAVGALDKLLRGPVDPAAPLEAEGQKLVEQDRAEAFLPGAGVAILRHAESYAIAKSGLVHYTFYDLRRVSGTTDVESGAQTYGPQIEGRIAPRLLRRRIYKRDGRVLEPDAAAHASQGHSDLSQLEQGDYVEHIADGFALPGDAGQLVIDTPDLLPERTSVREATIEVRRDASIPLQVWSHALLGAPEQRIESGDRVSVWRLREAAPRRIEDGVPRRERGVSVSVGTQTWANVARAVAENIRSFQEHDPLVTRWAREAAGPDKTPSRALVERVVAASGKAIRASSGGELSDVAAAFGGGAQYTTARSILALGQGSRSWVIYRALTELGVTATIAIAETEPFSSSPTFPPHMGRFRHPLVRVSLPGEPDLWIDADVEGPPLPPGRISPELRGREAMLAGGGIVTVEGAVGESGDEVDVRLVLDEKGDARGTFTILLHGRAAQSLAEAFETVVGSDRREILRGVVLGWLPWADVEDVTLSSTEGSWEVSLRATIAIQGYGRPEGRDGKTWVLPGMEPVHQVLPRPFAGTLGARYASLGGRTSTLSIDAPLFFHLRRRIELPPSAKVTRPAESIELSGGPIAASRKARVENGVIEDDLRLNLPTGTIAVDAYPAFVERVRAIDDAFLSGTRVRVKP